MFTPQIQASPDAATVLSKATVRAAGALGISHGRLAQILGVSAATVSRMGSGRYQLAGHRKEWELALLVVRLFRSLDSIVGNQDAARRWLQGENLALGAKPEDLILSAEGLVRVVQYLDASRARI